MLDTIITWFTQTYRNEALWFLMLIINFICIMIAYKKWGKIGLYIWVPISTILANIQVILLVDLFGMGATLGNILYAGGFLVTDILSENYGEKEAKTAVKIGFFSLIATALIMKVAISFAPTDIPDGLANLESVKRIFDFMPRIMMAGLIAYGISQYHDVWAYAFWKKIFPSDKAIWIRNNLSTMTSQIFDTLIFVTLAFWGVYPMDVLIEIFISTYIIKFMVAAMDTPFIYLASYLKKNNKIEELIN